VHTLLLEEYGVSKKWVIIKDKKQDSNTASTPSEASGPSAQDRYVARKFQEEFRENGVETEKNRDKSSNCDVCVTCDDVRCFL